MSLHFYRPISNIYGSNLVDVVLPGPEVGRILSFSEKTYCMSNTVSRHDHHIRYMLSMYNLCIAQLMKKNCGPPPQILSSSFLSPESGTKWSPPDFFNTASLANSWQEACLVNAWEPLIILDSFPLDLSVSGQNWDLQGFQADILLGLLFGIWLWHWFSK